MPDELDFDLRGTDTSVHTVEPVPPRPRWPFIAIALLLVAAGLWYVLLERRGSTPRSSAAATDVKVAQEQVKPLGGEPDPIAVPPLDESDPLVRTLVEKLSSHPRVAAWLATRGLIRNFTTVVVNIADGRTPASHLGPIRPAGSFQVIERGRQLVVDPRSYERYDALADAVTSLDTAGSARLYATLKPRIEEAYRELGFPDGSFDAALERAIVSLLATPVMDARVEVEPQGIGYGYADPRLERLTAAQKHLLRMGPANARRVQDKLREVALALGIPADRLPAAR
jgi:hypothetical protein